MRIGIIGCGNIGLFLLEKINLEKTLPNAVITSIFDERAESQEKLEQLAKQYQCAYMKDKAAFLGSDLDLVVECAHPTVAQQYAVDIIKSGKDILITSVGALVDQNLLAQLTSLASAKNSTIYVPSGAIGGLDALSAAKALGEIERVQLTTRKPPQALAVQVEGDEPQTVFSGTAAEAIRNFPQNINVAITLSLAGLGIDETKVLILADPNVERNIHEISMQGSFGHVQVTLENLPMPNNPKTSYLTALSALSTLKNINQPIKIGV